MSDTVIITFKVPPRLAEALDDYAEREGVSRSEVIREALKRLLRYNLGGTTEWRVKRVVLSPPYNKPEPRAEVSAPVRPTCEEVRRLKNAGLTWYEIAVRYGFASKYTLRNWFKRACKEV